eukprot:1338351-Rhodomonas_salina.1
MVCTNSRLIRSPADIGQGDHNREPQAPRESTSGCRSWRSAAGRARSRQGVYFKLREDPSLCPGC